jgi:Domain of unknown function (DUF4190)/GYF domain 2
MVPRFPSLTTMQYHITQNGEKSGPLEREEVLRRLVSGELKGSDLGWHEGMADWEPLAKLIPPPAPSAVPPPVFVSSAPALAARPTGTSGLAIGSLVCGILAVFSAGLTGLPAVIMGHMSLSRIKSSAGALGGKGMAIAGLVMGYFGFLLITIAILAALAIPAFNSVQNQALEIKVLNNAKQIVQGIQLYTNEHSGKLPPDLETLFTEGLLDDRRLLDFPGRTNVPGQGWDYRGAGLADTDPGSQIILVTRMPVRDNRFIIARNNGTAESVPASALQSP